MLRLAAADMWQMLLLTILFVPFSHCDGFALEKSLVQQDFGADSPTVGLARASTMMYAIEQSAIVAG